MFAHDSALMFFKPNIKMKCALRWNMPLNVQLPQGKFNFEPRLFGMTMFRADGECGSGDESVSSRVVSV